MCIGEYILFTARCKAILAFNKLYILMLGYICLQMQTDLYQELNMSGNGMKVSSVNWFILFLLHIKHKLPLCLTVLMVRKTSRTLY